jgi:Spy/CpxP family protein refolding chaperone
MTRSRLGALLLLVATFVLGGLLGGTLTSMAERREHGRRPSGPRPGYVERIGRDLDLSAEQKEKIQAVLDKHQPTMDSLWTELRQRFPQLDSERVAVRQEVFSLLTPDQQARYTAIIQRQDSLRRANGPERNRNAPRP